MDYGNQVLFIASYMVVDVVIGVPILICHTHGGNNFHPTLWKDLAGSKHPYSLDQKVSEVLYNLPLVYCFIWYSLVIKGGWVFWCIKWGIDISGIILGLHQLPKLVSVGFWPSGKKLGSDERSGSIYDNLMFWILWLKGAEESLKIHKDEWLRNPVVEMVLLKNWFLA
jgi:hypothetical protein